MNWADITLVTLLVLNLGVGLADHGRVKEEKVNFWAVLISSIISLVLYYYSDVF